MTLYWFMTRIFMFHFNVPIHLSFDIKFFLANETFKYLLLVMNTVNVPFQTPTFCKGVSTNRTFALLISFMYRRNVSP